MLVHDLADARHRDTVVRTTHAAWRAYAAGGGVVASHAAREQPARAHAGAPGQRRASGGRGGS
eukprot:2575107-Pleurochrysis_carterae.AAC.2